MDDWIIRKCQVAYDYLWDRWGIRAGTVTAAFYIVWCGSLLGRQTIREDMFFMALLGLMFLLGIGIAQFRNVQQDNGNYARLNASASDMENSKFQWALRFIFLPLKVVADIVLLQASWLAADLALIGVCYAFTIKVRERDESRFRKLVPVSSPAS